MLQRQRGCLPCSAPPAERGERFPLRLRPTGTGRRRHARKPIEVRKATLSPASSRKSRHGVRLNEHLEHPEGDVVFRRQRSPKLRFTSSTRAKSTVQNSRKGRQPGRAGKPPPRDGDISQCIDRAAGPFGCEDDAGIRRRGISAGANTFKRSGPRPRAQSQSQMRPGTRTADNRPAGGSLLGLSSFRFGAPSGAPVCSAFIGDSM